MLYLSQKIAKIIQNGAVSNQLTYVGMVGGGGIVQCVCWDGSESVERVQGNPGTGIR
jgi:hypothetical protein